MRSKATLLFLALLSPCYLAKAQSKPDSSFHLYILIGQSNMAGRGVVIQEFKNEGNARVLMLNKNNEWVLARHPIHFDKPTIVGVGPGLAFGLKMAETYPAAKIGLIPCAVGGSPIEHWVPGAFDEATKTHPYDDAALRIRAAMQIGIIKGVIWHQGEADSNPELSRKYLDQLKTLIERVRILVGNPRLPFIAGELGRYRPEYANINTELAKLPALVPYTAIATSEGLVHKGDTVHFDSQSAEELGKRYAVKILYVQQNGLSQK